MGPLSEKGSSELSRTDATPPVAAMTPCTGLNGRLTIWILLGAKSRGFSVARDPVGPEASTGVVSLTERRSLLSH